VSRSRFAVQGLLLQLFDAFRGSLWFMPGVDSVNAASPMDRLSVGAIFSQLSVLALLPPAG